MAKSKRALADEAWLRLNTPDNTGGLPGQLDIEGQIAEQANVVARETAVAAPPSLDKVPECCPSCGVRMTLAHGWAYSREGPTAIQCPKCGTRYAVPEVEHGIYRNQVRAYYAALPKAVVKKKDSGRKRTRGAG